MSFSKLRVAVLRGGAPTQYDSSLKTGETVLGALRTDLDRYDPVDIFVSKDGTWHFQGLPTDPDIALKHVDAAWNAIRDQRVSQALDFLKVPYTGTSAVPHAIALDHLKVADIYKRHDIPTLPRVILDRDKFKDKDILDIFQSYLLPLKVKPVGVKDELEEKIVHTFHELAEAIARAFEKSKQVVVEQLIKGKHATCAVLDNARGQQLYTLMPAQVKTGMDILCPGTFTKDETKKMQQMAKQAHKALGMRHYSESHFTVSPKGKIYMTETNPTPEISRESPFHKSLEATGWKVKDFVDHALNLAVGN